MIVIGDSYHKQCSSIPFCVIKTDLYPLIYVSSKESEKELESVKNLADLYPIDARVVFSDSRYSVFSSDNPGNEALYCLRRSYELWHNYFDISVPSYKQIESLRKGLKDSDDPYYPRVSYNELPWLGQKIKKGYIVSLYEKNGDRKKRLLLVYNSLKAAQMAKDRYCSYRYSSDSKYSLWNWYVFRVVISMSNPIALFCSYDSHMIGFWWCKLFSACLDESRKPKSTSHIFFHYYLDPDREEIRYVP